MTEIALAKIREVLTNSQFLKQLKKELDYSFETQISEVDGKIRMQFIQKDTGNENMSLGDLSAFLQIDKKALRLMTEARAQRSTTNRLPFIRVNKNLLFKRSDIVAWLERQGKESMILPPQKGKIPRKK